MAEKVNRRGKEKINYFVKKPYLFELQKLIWMHKPWRNDGWRKEYTEAANARRNGRVVRTNGVSTRHPVLDMILWSGPCFCIVMSQQAV